MKTKATLTLLAALAFVSVTARADDAMEAPVPVRTVAPKFPVEMRRDGTSGLVTVNCLIDEKGNVQEPKVEKASNDAFSQPALDAIKKWKFKPAKKGGEAVALRVSIPIQFNVTDSD
ncbi:MAG: TonB family protein [Oleiharenicola lentus]